MAAPPPTAAAAAPALGPDGLRTDGRSPSHIRCVIRREWMRDCACAFSVRGRGHEHTLRLQLASSLIFSHPQPLSTFLSPLTCERSLLPRADGSARWTAGGTTALAAVYGPTSTSARIEDPERAVVRATWRAAPGAGTAAGPPSSTPAAKALEAVLAGMVRAALLAEAAPRTAVSIDVTIEADDGGSMAAGLNAAAAALADAGGCLPLRALPAAASVVVARDGTLLADPTALEEADSAGTATFAFLTRAAAPDAPPSLVGGGGLAGASISGRLPDEQVLEATALAGGVALAAAAFNRAGLARCFGGVDS